MLMRKESQENYKAYNLSESLLSETSFSYDIRELDNIPLTQISLYLPSFTDVSYS